MSSARLILSAVAALLVAGCCSHGDKKTPMEKIDSQYRIIRKTAIAGRTLKVERMFSAHADCTLAEIGGIKVLQEPAHGNLVISERKDYPAFPEHTQREACNKKKLSGVFADYTPDEGFTGNDILVIEVITASGQDTTLKYLITVKQLSDTSDSW